MKQKNKCKINTLLLVLLVISIIIIILLCIFGLKNIIAFLKLIDYSALTAIVPIIAVIVTIIISEKNQKETIEATIKSNNQLAFENELYDILNIYNQLITDLSLLRIDWERPGDNNLIKRESIISWGDCTKKYKYLLADMEHRIYYHYKYYDNIKHDELDKLLKDIQGLNKSIEIKLDEYSKLAIPAYEINTENTKILYKKDMEDEKIAKINELYDKAKNIVNESSNIVLYISKLILDNKKMIYYEALSCIKERERIIKNYIKEE